jgi:DNA-binding MarR family transcriptional regulator
MERTHGDHPPGPRESRVRCAQPPPAALSALVGIQRAKLLAALEHSRSVGELDEILLTAPGGATYHVQRLEAAGVVRRKRRGQRVIVELTGRGKRLFALYSGKPPALTRATTERLV